MSSLRFHPSYRTFPLEEHANKVLNTYKPDLSGTKTYRMNSGGFRGQDYDPAAKRNIFVFGCSLTQGVGLNEEELWCHHVRQDYCALHGLQPEEVNLMNFGMSGGSNQEISRTVMMQCSVKKPDLAVVQFTFPERYEMITKDGIMFIGAWSPTVDWMPQEYREASGDRYRHYCDEEGAMDLVRNILAVQYFFAAKGIDYMLVPSVSPKLIPPAVWALVRLIDHKRILWLHSQMRRLGERKEFFVYEEPKAADDLHYGPSVHKLAASMVWKRYLYNRASANLAPKTVDVCKQVL